eukprot:m.17618 g.17618  ORF g.17618 m.17618 type:complete len:99 (-) comp4810_c0_seq1:105-401(-)
MEKSEKDKLLDQVYWIRQLVALACGLIWGSIALEGLPGLLMAAGILLLGPVQYAKYVLNSDCLKMESSEMMFEGLQGGAFLFLAVWVITYTTVIASEA